MSELKFQRNDTQLRDTLILYGLF